MRTWWDRRLPNYIRTTAAIAHAGEENEANNVMDKDERGGGGRV